MVDRAKSNGINNDRGNNNSSNKDGSSVAQDSSTYGLDNTTVESHRYRLRSGYHVVDHVAGY